MFLFFPSTTGHYSFNFSSVRVALKNVQVPTSSILDKKVPRLQGCQHNCSQNQCFCGIVFQRIIGNSQEHNLLLHSRLASANHFDYTEVKEVW